jgi:hypothetical protein
MNPAMTDDQPTPEFRARLEWQIQTSLRRESRFSEPIRPRLARMRTAAIALAALVVGGAAGMMPGYAQESRAREQLLDAARAEASLVQLRLELVRKEVDLARQRVDTGVAGRETLVAAEDMLRALELAIVRNRLDVEEIRATSAAPRNDLQAPLVGQRDFVRERLMLDLATAQRTLAAAEQETARARQRYEVGVAQATEVQQAQTDLGRAQSRMQLLGAMLDLRGRALQGSLKADELAASLRRVELTQRLEQVRQELDLAQARQELARRRFAVGTSSEVEVKQAELAVLERHLELKKLQQELQSLGAKKE